MHVDPGKQANPRVAVIIPAKDEAERIGATVRAVKALPYVDLELIVVVDDGSSDDTQAIARQAGAVTVRHTVNRGKASSMETGAKVVAMRAVKGETPPLLLFLDADLGDTAAEAAPLIEPVIKGEADFTIAVLPRPAGAGGHGFVLGLSRWAIRRTTGWNPQAPLSGQRCLTTAAFQAALPLAAGWGVETDMTISLLSAGFAVKEVPVAFKHRVSRRDFGSQMHRLHQFIDVAKALSKLRARRVHVKKYKFLKVALKQKPGEVYRVPLGKGSES
ncbi:glycosyltransferase family 2 protein [uncultured Varibaculum sp.]|uniref:glycosyltransferase family 2 protein n=1 Tax=uncultured Varibaculum sp. TaxID=413896 RepID=UPI00259862D9|nr:glycosyltransferase family 2 protein [uncultured Varibaculum sp.]